MRREPRRFAISYKVLALVIAAIVLLVIPQFITRFQLEMLFWLVVYILFAESYDLFSGYTGYYNLGHGAFFALGAYAFAMLELQIPVYRMPVLQVIYTVLPFYLPIYVTIPIAVLVVALFAAGMSYPFFRLRGAYFAVATFGLVYLLFYLAMNLKEVTGGRSGLHLAQPGVYTMETAYYMTMIVALVCIYVNYRLSKSKLGLALISIREDEDVAKECGINPFRAKMKALVLSAVFAGFAGATFAYAIGVANPDGIISMERALAPVVITIFGGAGLFQGPLIGAILLRIIEEVLWIRLAYFHLFTYGILLMVAGLLAPGGIARARGIRRLLRVKA